jgi:glycosyltransferase involved in cell wall biosynthesis
MANQDYPNMEIVLILDGPIPEDLHRAIMEVKESVRVDFKIIRLAQNQGLGPALNEAVKAATGDYLARMDTDDYSHPDRIKTQMEFLSLNPDVDVVGCCMEEQHDNGKTIVTSMPLTHQDCLAEFVRRDPLHHPTALFRRRFFEKAGPYSSEYPLDEDSAMWLAGMRGGCIFANLPIAKYTMFLDKGFFARRKSFDTIWVVSKVRLRIIREMGYGVRGYGWAVLRIMVMLLPAGALRIAYMLRGRMSEAFSVKGN